MRNAPAAAAHPTGQNGDWLADRTINLKTAKTREGAERPESSSLLTRRSSDTKTQLAAMQRCPLWRLCHEERRSKRRCVTVREMKEGPSRSAIRG
jgi:hypothetical protein